MTADPRRPDNRGAARAAREVHRAQRIGHPGKVAIELVARRMGLLITASAITGAIALMMRTARRGIAVVAPGDDPGARRFSMAHELGHYVLHALMSHLPLCLDPDIDHELYRKSPTEREADVFAREFLMPRKLILAIFGDAAPTWDAVAALSAEFVVSMTAAALRLVELSDQSVALVHSTGTTINWMKPSFRLRKRTLSSVLRGSELPAESLARSAPEGLHLPSRALPVGAWLPDSGIEGELVEQVYGIPGGALTLLELRGNDAR